VKARKLEKQKFGKPDPYVVLTYGTQVEKSKVIKGNLKPEWNLEKVFDVTAKSPKEIIIEVYDKDTVTKDDFMGRTSVLISDVPKLRQGRWIPLKDCKSGEVFVSGEIIPTTSSKPVVVEAEPNIKERIQTASTPEDVIIPIVRLPSTDTTSMEKDNQLTIEEIEGILTEPKSEGVKETDKEHDKFIGIGDEVIFILHGANKLMNKDTLGKSDPYAVISLGSQTSRTKTINNDLNPTWQHEVLFRIEETSPSNIKVEFFDDDYGKDEPLGNTSVSVQEIKRKERISSQPQKLSDCKTGEMIYSAKYVDKQLNLGIVSTPEDVIIPIVRTSTVDTTTQKETISSQRKVDKVSKTVDQFGNVITEDVQTITLTGDGTLDQLAKQISQEIEVDKTQRKTSDINNIKKPTGDGQFGQITFILHSAKNLENKDRFGKSDPFGKIRYGSQVSRTKTIDNDLNPIWEHQVTFNVEETSPSNIEIELFDDDYGGKEEYLGKVVVDIADIKKEGKIVSKSQKLSDGKSGEMVYSVSLDSTNLDTTGKPKEKAASSQNIPSSMVGLTTGKEAIPSEGKITRVRKVVDEFGNVVSEDVETIDIQGDDFSKFVKESAMDIPEGMEVITSERKVSTVRRTVDQFGNVISEDVQTTVLKGDEELEQLSKLALTDIPAGMEVASSQSKVTSVKRVVDQSGKVVSENIETTSIEKDDQLTLKEIEGILTQPKSVSSKKSDKEQDKIIGIDDEVIFILHGAKKLMNKDTLGKSDPYAVVSFGSQISRTKTINNDLNPTWQHEVVFRINETSPSNIKVEFFDDDYGKDEPLGNTSVSIQEIKKKGSISSQPQKLSNCKTGQMIYSAKYVDKQLNLGIVSTPGDVIIPIVRTSTVDTAEQKEVISSQRKVDKVSKTVDQFGNVISENVQTVTLTGDKNLDQLSRKISQEIEVDKSQRKTSGISNIKKQTGDGQFDKLTFTLHSAWKLENKDRFGKSDPFAKIRYGSQVSRTKTIDNELNPIWEHQVTFNVDESSPSNIEVEFYDDDYGGKEEYLGKAVINIAEVKKEEKIGQSSKLSDGRSGEMIYSASFNNIVREPGMDVSTSQRKVTSIKKTIDEHGNVISENVETSTFEGDDDFKNLTKHIPHDESSNVRVISSQRKVTSVKKVLDEFGNVISEDVQTTDLEGDETFHDLSGTGAANLPAGVEMVTSQRKVTRVKKIVDELGNVISEETETTTEDGDGECDLFAGRMSEGMPEEMQGITSHTTVTSVKRTLDQYGNVISEDVQSTTHEGEKDIDQLIQQQSQGSQLITKRATEHTQYPSDAVIHRRINGSVKLTIIRAKDLENKEWFGKSDPFVVLKYKNEEHKSKTINNNLNPEWNFSQTFQVSGDDLGTIHVNVFDEDYTGNVPLGNVDLDVQDLILTGNNDQPVWVKLLNCKSGEIQISSVFTQSTEGDDEVDRKTSVTRISSQGGEKPFAKSKPTQKSRDGTSDNRNNTGNLDFTVIKAKDLENKEWFGKSDPFVVLKYKNEEHKSMTINNNLNPEWNFSQIFPVSGDDLGTIHVNVFDEDYTGNVPLGNVDFEVKELISNANNNKPTWVKLNNCKSGEIQISSVFTRSTDADDEITQETRIKKLSSGSPQEFDRLVRKSFKKIIRTIDSEGNVTEQVVEDNDTPDKWERATMDMPAGMEVMTSHGTVTSVHKTVDEFGNVISEDVQTRTFEDDQDYDQFARSSGSPVKKTVVKTIKKTIRTFSDESGDGQLPEIEDSNFSETVFTTVDSDGNVIERVVRDDEIDWDPVETKTSQRTVDDSKKSSMQIYQDQPKFDQIIFILHGAKDLVNKDVDMYNHSDPYAVISFGSQVSRTEFINNELNPTWQHQVTFQVDDRSPSHINIEFYDADVTKDERLGNTSIEVAKIRFLGSISSEARKLSNCSSGDIIYSAKYIAKVGEVKIPRSSVPGGPHSDDEDDEHLEQRMKHLGFENVIMKARDTDSAYNTEGLMKDVTRRQGGLKEKIDTLKKTIRKSIDGSSEGIYTTEYDSEIVANPSFSQTYELLDNQGNVMPRCGGSVWQNTKYYHTSSQPFQNITSLRAHFVTAFEPDVPDLETKDMDRDTSSVQMEESFSTFVGGSSYRVVSSSSTSKTSTQATFGSPTLGHNAQSLELFLSESGREVKAELTPTGTVKEVTPAKLLEEDVREGSQIKEWIQPVISSSCLVDKKFWKEEGDQTITSYQSLSSSHTNSPDGCQCSGSHSLRSPVSVLMSGTPSQSVQSLPSSPQRKQSVKQKTVVTSELFSSDEDKSRSLELIYTEPEDNQRQILSSIYRSASPAKDHGSLEKRKASFTQVKRVSVIDRQQSDSELLSGSSSPDMSKGTKNGNFSPQFTSSPLAPQPPSSVRGIKGNVTSGFEEQVPAPEFDDYVPTVTPGMC